MKLVKALFLLMLVAQVSTAQTKSDVFDPSIKITWLGLDFTDAKFIGDRERYGSESDFRRLIEAWNTLIITEKDKYNIATATQRAKVEYATDVTTEHNVELDVLPMYTDAEKEYLHLSRDRVSEIVAEYDFKGLSGVGLMFNIESFSKLHVEAAMWITFVSMDTKEVLFTERLTAPPGGFGMRNYWAGSIATVLQNMKKKEFEMWKKKYYRP